MSLLQINDGLTKNSDKKTETTSVSEFAIGIDLGTTNSLVAVVADSGKAIIFEDILEEINTSLETTTAHLKTSTLQSAPEVKNSSITRPTKRLIPSVVYLKNNQFIVGNQALAEFQQDVLTEVEKPVAGEEGKTEKSHLNSLHVTPQLSTHTAKPTLNNQPNHYDTYHRNNSQVIGTSTLSSQSLSAQGSPTANTHSLFKSVKKLMGKGLEDIKDSMHLLPFNIDTKTSDKVIKIKIGDKLITPEEISAEILAYLKNNAEQVLKQPITKAVITVPAYFDELARTATKNAAKLAGLEVLRLINEPTAAALAYGLDEGTEGVYIIYDFGGGTFDVSILNMQKGVFKVLSTLGDTSLGGNDIDLLLAEDILHQFNQAFNTPHTTPHKNSNKLTHNSTADIFQSQETQAVTSDILNKLVTLNLDKSNVEKTEELNKYKSANQDTHNERNTLKQLNHLELGSLNKRDLSKLLDVAKAIKEELSNSETFTQILNFQNKNFTYTLSRTAFEVKISNILSKTITICNEALKSGNINLTDIKGVVLVGGSTRIPYLQKMIAKHFNVTPLCSLNPDEVVALGAAYQANNLIGKGQNSLLLDVVPLSLGIEIMGNLTEKIILRNTPTPVAKAQEFTTYKDNQTSMLIHVLQGERELATQNRSLAKFSLKGIPPLVSGAARILVTFSVDTDGLLTIKAKESLTNIEQSIEVKPTYGLSLEDMKEMLINSLRYGQEDLKLRLLSEEKIEAEQLLDTITSALELDSELLTPSEIKELQFKMDNLKNLLKNEPNFTVKTDVTDTQELSSKVAEQEAVKKNLSELTTEQAKESHPVEAILEYREKIQIHRKDLEVFSTSFAERRMNKAIKKLLTGKSIQDIENSI